MTQLSAMHKMQAVDNNGFYGWHGLCKCPSDGSQSEGHVTGSCVAFLELLKARSVLRFRDKLFAVDLTGRVFVLLADMTPQWMARLFLGRKKR